MGRRRLGLTDAEFWAMSPRMYFALLEQDQALERHQDLRAGILAMLIANPHRDEARHPDPFRPSDFFPSLARGEDEEEVQDPEAQIAALDFFAAILAPSA